MIFLFRPRRSVAQSVEQLEGVSVIFRNKRKFDPDLSRELKAYAFALTRDRDVADDLLQEVLLKIYESKNLPDDDDNAKRYSFRMMRNLHIDNLRKTNVRLEYSIEQERLYSTSVANDFDTVDQLIVRDAFSQLTQGQREILFLVDVMGFKYSEAAVVTEVPVGTIMSRVSRARAEMMKKLEDSPVRSLNQNRKIQK